MPTPHSQQSSFSGDDKKETQSKIFKQGTIKLHPLSANTTCAQLPITYTIVFSIFY